MEVGTVGMWCLTALGSTLLAAALNAESCLLQRSSPRNEVELDRCTSSAEWVEQLSMTPSHAMKPLLPNY